MNSRYLSGTTFQPDTLTISRNRLSAIKDFTICESIPDTRMCSNQNFSRKQRLLLPADYKFVFNQPTRSSDKLLTILGKKNPVQNQARLGLAVAKKSVKKAVQRNRIKRLTREFFRLNQDKVACADYVLMVRNGIDKMDNKTITQSLSKQFNYLRKKLSE